MPTFGCPPDVQGHWLSRVNKCCPVKEYSLALILSQQVEILFIAHGFSGFVSVSLGGDLEEAVHLNLFELSSDEPTDCCGVQRTSLV